MTPHATLHEEGNASDDTSKIFTFGLPFRNQVPANQEPEPQYDEALQQDREIGDDEDQSPQSSQPQTSSEWKRRHVAIFTAYRQQFEKSMDEEDIKPREGNNGNKEQFETLKDLSAQQSADRVIDSPRDYQMELFERAKKQNTIAVLGTGSGKTLIAVMLLKYFLEKEVDDRASGKPRRIAFFLVEKVTLVFQQLNTIKTNLYHRVDQLCGAMGCQLWDAATWLPYFETNDVIVCTSDVLLHALMHAFVRMDQINLLIFDEAHHTKKSHSYARIVRDFYNEEPASSRPHIFGMTASPVDVEDKCSVTDNARELELLLNAQIATVNSLVLNEHVPKPTEQCLLYERLSPQLESKLYQSLKARYWDLKEFGRLFDTAKGLKYQLGPWCADFYWSFAFSERAHKKLEQRYEQQLGKIKESLSREKIDREIDLLRQAQEHIAEYDFGDLNVTQNHLSTKVIELHNYLRQIFERPSSTRCLVFVQRKHTARLLKAVFDRVGGPNLRSGELVGSGTGNFDSVRYSFRDQLSTLIKFKKGEINCVFATSVAEEGLDVPECNLVVRFDLCQTMIQYVQSRGRARQKNSKFVHLIEMDNSNEEYDLDKVRGSEAEMRAFCASLPRDRLLGSQDNPEFTSVKERAWRVYKHPKSGARLDYPFSLMVVQHYVDCLPFKDGEDMSINYNIFVRHGKFQSEVTLPAAAQENFRTAVGRAYMRKSSAKMSAAYEVCLKLLKHGHLNDRFLPDQEVRRRKRNALTNARTAQNMGSGEHPVLLKPAIWEEKRGSVPRELFMTILWLDGIWDRSVQPLALLTRTRLLSFPRFPLFRITGEPADVATLSLDGRLSINGSQLDLLTSFTLKIFKDIFNKKFEHDNPKMSYWLAPLQNIAIDRQTRFMSPSSLLDWTVMSKVIEQDATKWHSGMKLQDFEDKFMVDPYDGGRRLFTYSVDPSLALNDSIPEHVAPGPKGAETIIDYSSSLYRRSKARRRWDQDQPVIRATRILHRQNVLAPPSDQDQKAVTKCFVCPEPLDISPLPAPVAAMGLLFPAIIHRMESYLIALELCKRVQINVRPDLALEAITKDSDNTENAEAEAVNFQRGMGRNYERLEFIGDCFLKMVTSMAVFMDRKVQDEGNMHVVRMMMLCNKTLFESARDAGYPKYIRGLAFSRRTWYPEGLKLLEGKGALKGPEEKPLTSGRDDQHQQKTEEPRGSSIKLKDKTVADVCEALIGACLETHVKTGYEESSCFDDAVMAVTQFIKSIPEDQNKHRYERWSEYLEAYEPPEYLEMGCSAHELDKAERVREAHDYSFKEPKLLMTAFTDPSMPRVYAGGPSYQRLEFLGDSLLDMVCELYLFHKYPDKDPQWLTEHKMAMVANQFQGALCVKLGFHRFLKHNSSPIQNSIKNYVEELEEAERENQGSLDYWRSIKNPPKCLADIVESYVGAMFVDSRFKFAEVQRFFDQHIVKYFEDMAIYDSFAGNHPMNKLRAMLESSFGCHNWRVMAQEIEATDERPSSSFAGALIHDHVVSKVHGESSKNAKASAAKQATDALEGLAPFEFREMYGCNCTSMEDDRFAKEDSIDEVEDRGTAA